MSFINKIIQRTTSENIWSILKLLPALHMVHVMPVSAYYYATKLPTGIDFNKDLEKIITKSRFELALEASAKAYATTMYTTILAPIFYRDLYVEIRNGRLFLANDKLRRIYTPLD